MLNKIDMDYEYGIDYDHEYFVTCNHCVFEHGEPGDLIKIGEKDEEILFECLVCEGLQSEYKTDLENPIIITL